MRSSSSAPIAASYTDLRGWLEATSAMGELRPVRGAHWRIEIGALTEMMTHRLSAPPALLFDEIPDYAPGFRILTNSMASPKRLALTLGLPEGLSGISLVDAWRKRMRTIQLIPPSEVDSGSILEHVQVGGDVDLRQFPAPLWHEEDGGRYLGTGCIAITRDPDTDWVNAGTYRMMVQGPDRLGIYRSPGRHATAHERKYFERGTACPIAVSLGHDPLLLVAGSATLAPEVNELAWAGGIKGAPVPVIRAPATGLPVPANSEIVVEGEVWPGDRLPEGPFGEWTGYYASNERPEPYIRVQSILYREDPIVLGAAVSRPPDDTTLPNALTRCALTWNALEDSGVPDVRGVWQLQPTLMCVIAIKQRYGGHAAQVAQLAAQAPGTAYLGRYVVVVDDDIDITDWQDVLWAVCTRVDPQRDIEIVPRCWSGPLDPAIEPDLKGMNSRALIDATRPYAWRDRFPKAAQVSPAIEQHMLDKWGAAFFSPGTPAAQTAPSIRLGV